MPFIGTEEQDANLFISKDKVYDEFSMFSKSYCNKTEES